MLSKKRNIHFVGIGGIGMSAIARVLIGMGHNVSGSDLELNAVTRRLESAGGRISAGHRASNVPDGTHFVVYSSSIPGENPEIAEAARRGIKTVHRARMLGEIFNRGKGIAVAGTHGKTTTTSLISVMLKNAGLDPTAMIGGEVALFGGNAALGRGEYIVAEADESDSSFRRLKPYYAVLTNIEMEHLDHFKSLGDITRSYAAFIKNLKPGGAVFYNAGDANVRAAMKGLGAGAKTFGFGPEADIYPSEIRMDGFRTSFRCIRGGKDIGEVRLSIPGRHNVLNALAAILVGLEMGLSFKAITRSIGAFTGAKRRFQLRADSGGVMLIDDYAHHPTEIRAVLDACRNWKGRRVIAIFQPHRYTRTKMLAEEFGRCFGGADKLILTGIFAASERAIKGVSAKTIRDRVRASGMSDVVIMKKETIAGYVMKIKRRGDIVLVLGAGDIKKVADELSRRLGGSDFDAAKKAIRGDVRSREPLSRRTSLGIGGPADIWVEPRDAADLKRALEFARDRAIPFFVIGNGSNLLAGDGGYRGMMINLGSDAFRRVRIDGTRVRVGAGFGLPKLVRRCCEEGLAGLESLVGIPGTVGGAIRMNAGGYSNPVYRNIGSMVESLKVMDFEGKVRTLGRDEAGFGYRTSNLNGCVILEAVLKLEKGDSRDLVASSLRFLKMKREKHVLDKPNAGCVFKNPKGFPFTCGQMIDMLKFKGKRLGGAQISEKHANFIVNRSGATCKDVMALIDFVRRKVKQNYDIDLELEVERVL
jgi:UDP-N-acetylmuramate--L-alanine ligase/UDP-N-acetylenolpyruvoylglucosamine reductase